MKWLQARQANALEGELAARLRPLDAMLRKRAIGRVAAQVTTDPDRDFRNLEQLTISLINISKSCLSELSRLEHESSSLLVAYQQAFDETERREILRRHLTAQQQDPRQSRKDVLAVSRWLDIEALRERYSAEISNRVDEVLVCHDAITHLLTSEEGGPAVAHSRHRSGLIRALLAQAAPQQRACIRRAALAALTALLRRVEPSYRSEALGIRPLRHVVHWARGEQAARWVQTAALELLAVAAPDRLEGVMVTLLGQHSGEDSMVIRAACARNVSALLPHRRPALARRIFQDPSEHVRQVLARTLVQLPGRHPVRLLLRLVLKDASVRVRGTALLALVHRATFERLARQVAHLALKRILVPGEPTLIVRVALQELLRLYQLCREPEFLDLCPQLSALVTHPGTSLAIADQAAAVVRSLELESDRGMSQLTQQLREHLSQLDEGKSVTLTLEVTQAQLLRALQVAARGDHAVAVTPKGPRRYRITRGEPRRLRLWRLWHEARTPMPDKRKGYVHSHGRAPLGPYLIPPIGMAEVTPTRVPGERVLHNTIGGWGTFLPRIDDLLTTALRRTPLVILTTFGSLVLKGPVTVQQRMKAWYWLSRNYAKISLIRETSLEAQESADQQSYMQLVASLGYSVSLEQAPITRLWPPALGRFFSTELIASLGVLALPPDLWQQFFVHALSPNANDPSHLALVIWIILMAFIVRAAYIMQGIVRAREAIPLRIGGWGTRGKSGSERLKAALFHALRYDVVVKTTGCEAMFIHAQRDLPAQEIFIYRPYDKATIWEQRDMLKVAQQLKAQVFLWECMALQPRFVETLIDEWMKDPVTTLTNAYPDHEDIQGPGGEDVARVIGRFSPRGGITFTTEEQMLPLLMDAARTKGGTLIPVPPLDADLLPQDLLNRLPYQEHPRNVALVLTLAAHFQIDPEYALVEIADHVVLDLGVLKTYPETPYRGRRLVFSNGMSANERAGFMSNWTRLAFDRHDPDSDSDTVTVSVVNNRADRPARSRVFAQILVDDASLNAIVLINSNLGGLHSFIVEALDKRLTTLRITGDGPPERMLERAEGHLRWLKVPLAPDALLRSFERMIGVLSLPESELETLGHNEPLNTALLAADSDHLATLLDAALPKGHNPEQTRLLHDVRTHLLYQAKRIALARKTLSELRELGSAKEDPDALFRKTYRELFLDRIVILWNTGATGDQVIDFMTDRIPPGYQARIMGTQNIKGTGLDFVYRWLSIDRVVIALERLKTHPSSRQETLAWLGSYNDFGLLDATAALRELQQLKAQNDPAWQPHEHLLAGVISRLEHLITEKQTKLHAVGKADWLSRVAGGIEALVDHLDSARRSSLAKRVMDDLFAARVGHGKAALLLRDITGRQKGGWLAKDIKQRFGKRT